MLLARHGRRRRSRLALGVSHAMLGQVRLLIAATFALGRALALLRARDFALIRSALGCRSRRHGLHLWRALELSLARRSGTL